jgi:hypothetical protein
MLLLPSHTCAEIRVEGNGERSGSGSWDGKPKWGPVSPIWEAEEVPAQKSRWARGGQQAALAGYRKKGGSHRERRARCSAILTGAARWG